MAFFRSESMSFCQMLLHQESAFDCLIELGYLGNVQFVEMPSSEYVPNLRYNNELTRTNDAYRTVRRLQESLDKVGLKEVYHPNVDKQKPLASNLKDIEAVLQQIDAELADVDRNCDTMHARRDMLSERQRVLDRADSFLTSEHNTEAILAISDSVLMNLLYDGTRGKEQNTEGHLIFISGALPIERFYTFETMIFRVSRGNALVKRAEFALPDEREPHQQGKDKKKQKKVKKKKKQQQMRQLKIAFLIVFTGEELHEKLLKVCQGFHAALYRCPESTAERHQYMLDTAEELNDLEEVMKKSCEYKRRILSAIVQDLYVWRMKLKKMRATYTTLNRLSLVNGAKSHSYFQTECWIPRNDVPKVRAALMYAAKRAARGSEVMFPPLVIQKTKPEGLVEPTYFRLNRFTKGFQNLIDAYGMANYKELNPAPYTIVTFPFLFAVMFGDVGHGVIMTIFAYILILFEDKFLKMQRASRTTNEIASILFAGRYIILFMGIFSVYTGLLYNETFSKGMNIAGSRWRQSYTYEEIIANKHLQFDPENKAVYLGSPYLFGIDPVWDASGENAITTINSIKMKMAVILGVSQMIFGLVLSAVNAVYFKSMIDVFLVFVPQLIFLLCLFFYLVFLIFFKWVNFGGHHKPPYNTACAPSVLITFIDMILFKDKGEDPPPGCQCWMYKNQHLVQMLLVIIAFLSIPVLLCGKPIHFMIQHRKIKLMKDTQRQDSLRRDTMVSLRKSLIYSLQSEDSELGPKRKKETVGEERLSEIWIHQGIHTIESVLGSVSHTASYLRLWALSLAHDQLSAVLWEMVLRAGLKGSHGFFNSIILVVAFFFWALLTLAILVLMEALSAFLHTLRLHWVEFQSKFYLGSGEGFSPFYFQPSTAQD